MEHIDFDWLSGNWASNLKFSTFDSPRDSTTAEPANHCRLVSGSSCHTPQVCPVYQDVFWGKLMLGVCDGSEMGVVVYISSIL